MNTTLEKSASRIEGLDIARCLAIFGMTWIHVAALITNGANGDDWLTWLLNRFAGRPATIFMILAGIGISLRIVGKPDRLIKNKKTILVRGVFFLIFGFAHLSYWPADILRVYGVSFLIAAFFLTVSGKTLWTIAAGFVVGFVGLMLCFDFETNWDWSTLSYANLWTPGGSAMNLFFNGFRAVFPWTALLFVGMWIGRFDLRSRDVRRKLMLGGLLLLSVGYACSVALILMFPGTNHAETELIWAIAGTDSLPATPLFLITSTGFSVMVIAACLALSDRYGRFTMAFVKTGQMAFTWYILHIWVAIVLGELYAGRTLAFASTITVLTCMVMLFLSRCYRMRFAFGPLEQFMRRVCG